ncbi:MAG: thioredoxin family protein [Saprospiraceae bacterium]|uniref:Thioredoxin family protein n=1 Tax=Candidatus Opimibacter skivensis TaxID=2982028 RepID=A0A9D7SX76_9BACT|nr:thioredoxin family protein [Candidatus Opimibacter skivensis]
MKGRRFRSSFVLICLACLVSIAFAFRSIEDREKSDKDRTISDFRLLTTDGNIVSLSDYKDAKGFIIVFTSNHCPFAKLYTSRLNDLYSRYSPLDVPLLAINSMDSVVYEEENFEMMKQKSISASFKFPYLWDRRQTVGKDFGATHTPHAFVIWKENNQWIIEYSGAIDDNGAEPNIVRHAYVDEALKELLSGQHVTLAETHSIGCAIYYRR